MKYIRCTAAAIPLFALFALSALPAAHAQTWPAKPVRLLVGFSAGGPTDVVARAFADHASRALGQPFIVDNKPGANTILAAEAAASAPADGYTLLLGATNHTMIPALYSARVKFDAVRSFAPVCSLAVSPTVLVVGPSMPVGSFEAFLQAVKAEPGKRTYATPGSGSSGHFASAHFTRMTGTSMNHIPYKGAAQAITDLIGGQVDSSFATLGSVLAQVKSGKLTALAVAAPQRSALLPNVPTFDEVGVKGYTADAWYGLLAPANTPPQILATLRRVATEFSQAPGTQEKLRAMGLEPQNKCADAFGAQLAGEVKLYGELAKTLDLKTE
ncbi:MULTISPECIES: tripartite tricarboxylate transporter substrate binding protein [unclassified Variovorax]|uniref:Bug family tripartite tricarboxylate transporter substrate binding protein n=1 Tax=unclassified Variovorax TaxID=663243 RepID=UPI0008C82C7E|nr:MULTISPECIES: tripartite tricarboxylate transporter substrate binding protein [unclassified Variovorax]SEK08366.1 Tripartite-type tricarboxylate transporter, receptor component TctC [Variovorax sp. OK202]SFD55542.1 Tripartite-type tricarboxylate transporter, receptor component TctC [Variovorax sp. OK212]